MTPVAAVNIRFEARALHLPKGKHVQATFVFTPATGVSKGVPQKIASTTTQTVDPAGTVEFTIRTADLTRHHEGAVDWWVREADDDIDGEPLLSVDGIPIKQIGVRVP